MVLSNCGILLYIKICESVQSNCTSVVSHYTLKYQFSMNDVFVGVHVEITQKCQQNMRVFAAMRSTRSRQSYKTGHITA